MLKNKCATYICKIAAQNSLNCEDISTTTTVDLEVNNVGFREDWYIL
jgi:hypothetical protein